MIRGEDGTQLYYKDRGSGSPVVFSHGWPLDADAWDYQLLFLSHNGFRTIAHDRRGHGRSEKPWAGNDMDTYADDLAAVLESLDVRDATLVGHSTGGGEVVRYIGRHGDARVRKVVLVSAVPPLMLQTKDTPDGVPLSVFDDIRERMKKDYAQYYLDLSAPFFGANSPGSNVSEGIRRSFWRSSMEADLHAAYECVKAFSETDFHDDLRNIEVPALIIHGDDDQIVPIDISARKSAKLIPHATLKIYTHAPHGIPITHNDQLNMDLLEFLRQ